MEPGLTTTWPRSTSSRFRPRSRRPQFSPAHASSSCLWNISIPVTVVFWTGRMPTISTSELMARVPRSARPVTTVPRPVIVKTSSIGIRKGLSRSRTGSGTDSSTASMRSSMDLTHSGSPSRAVSSGNHEDCAVHLSSTGDHVLDVVSVTGGVYVCVVALFGLVLNVGDVDGNAALTLFGSRVNRREVTLLVESRVLVVQHLGNGGRQRRLTVVNVTNGTDVNVRLSPLELCLCHRFLLERFQMTYPSSALVAAETPASLLGGLWIGEIADSGTNTSA